MRVAQLIEMPLLHPGGVEVLVRELLKGLGENIDHYLVAQEHEEEIRRGCDLPVVAYFQINRNQIDSEWNATLVHWLKEHQVDLVHFHLGGTFGWRAKSISHGTLAAVARSGIPVLATNHQVIRFFGPGAYPHPLWRKVLLSIMRWPAKAYQLLKVREEICVSKHDQRVMRRSYPGLGKQIGMMYHSRLDETVEVRQMPESRLILNVATIAFRKGQHLLVEAFCRVADEFPEWRLRLVGSLTQRECVDQIRAMIATRGLERRIELVGPIEDPTDEYRGCEIYVQPSLLEGLGLSLQEAMFHGRACLGTDAGGIPELIENERCGVLCGVGDVEAMADGLRRLMRDREKRERLGAGARASILERGMTKQAMLNAYRKKYQEIIHS